MKKTIMILVAMALILGLPQCKKQTTGVLEGTVDITLDVGANKGSRIIVDPVSGDVAFEQNDVVYVGSGGKFVGTLTCRGTSFKGQITDATLGEPLYFFFLGNKTPAETLTAGTSTSCSVVVSDQTSKLPVISYATSDQNFTGKGTYTAFFLNKAALVKFDVTTPSNSPVCLVGMNNKVEVDFTNNGFAFSKEGEGRIALAAGSGERWAILLPQASMNSAFAHTLDFVYNGTCGHIPPIGENHYHTEGIEVNVSDRFVDLGLPSGLLWANHNIGANSPDEYGDYFAWGETQPKDFYDVNTYQYCNDDIYKLTKYCNSSDCGYNGFTDNLTTLEPGDDAAVVNWGNDWRMPTKAEFEELINNTTVTWTTLNGVNGRLFTAANGNSLFLPAAGFREFNYLNYAGSIGFYWSSSLSGTPIEVWDFYFRSDNYFTASFNRIKGLTVRPVRSAH